MKRSIILLLSFLLVINVFSQVKQPVKWAHNSKILSSTEAELIFTATIENKWHLYSQFVKSGGPVPTAFKFEKSNNYILIGSTKETKPKKVYDDIFNMNVLYFDNKATFTQKIKILSSKPFIIKGTYEYMTCNEESCIPFFDNDYEIKITPEFNNNISADTQTLVKNNVDTSKTDSIISRDAKNQVENDKMNIAPGTENKSLWMFFLISFLAGLAAILTPCVFPMIPMTVSFFMHDTKGSKNKAKLEAIIYGISIILIYTVIGTIVAITLGANFANWLSTHWLPNIFFFLIFMVFAASFLGAFEIVLPSWLVNKADSKADKGGYLGAFFMAFTLVLVSFSCTGPIVGAILVQSAGGMVIKPIVGMFGFSLAFALPFALFAFFPEWLNKLPKSGGWLNSVKVTLGFIELALGLKFLSIADQTYHWRILDREIYLALWIIIFTLLGFYFLGKLKFKHDSDVKHIGVFRLSLAIVTFSFVVYLIPGMIGAPLKALSGYMPPQTSQDFDISEIIRENANLNNSSKEDNSTLCAKAKYSDFLDLPHGLTGYFDYQQGLECAKAEKKPIFIDFTGHGCVNCREMEASVWSNPKVLKLLREKYIIIALYVDDKTKLPENEWITSNYDKKIKKTLGAKNADLQISRYNVNAQPYYVLLDGEEKLLMQPRAYNKSVDEFVEFLQKGIDEYAKRNK